MGTLIALLFALDRQADLAGLVLTGCALRPALANPLLITMVRALDGLIPQARLVPELNLHAISRDPAVVAAYAADPLVYHGKLPVALGAATARSVQDIERRLPQLRLPVLALHGSADQLTLPAGTQLLAARATSAQVTVHIWEGLYHEVHNEPEQAAVLDEIAAWLDARLAA
jgi:lysophospholipase